MPKQGATSYKETSVGILPRQKVVQFEAEGVKRGIEYIYSQAKKNRKIRIDLSFILKLHKISFGWIFPDWAGKFRTVQVTFSNKEAPPYYKVREFITNMCLDLGERLKNLPNKSASNYIQEVIKLLAWFQHRFVFIHPFKDYNGRIARMLTIVILISLDLPPIEIKAETGKDRKIYIAAMREADEGNLKSLEKLIKEALDESLQNIKQI